MYKKYSFFMYCYSSYCSIMLKTTKNKPKNLLNFKTTNIKIYSKYTLSNFGSNLVGFSRLVVLVKLYLIIFIFF